MQLSFWGRWSEGVDRAWSAGNIGDSGFRYVQIGAAHPGLADGPIWDKFLAALRKNGAPTVYMFRCVKCGQFGGYHDYD